MPIAGRAEGKEVIRGRLAKMLECFEYLVFRPLEIVDTGDNVRSRVEIVVRHRASRETYFGKLRLVITVENDLMTRIEEFHDAALLEAFMRFAESLD